MHDEASDFAKSHLKKRVARKVAMLSYSVAFSFRNEFRFVSLDSCLHAIEAKFRSGLKSRFGMRLGSNSIRIEL